MPGDERLGGVLKPTPESLVFDEIYAEHFAFVWRCLRSLGVPLSALDDAAQDVFVIVHRQLPAFRGESTLQTWLFGITRKVAFNHRRGVDRKQAPLVPLDDRYVQASGPSPIEHAQEKEAAAFVERFMAALDEEKRALFLLALLEEMAMPEVAAALEIPLNTAYTRLRRLRSDFQQALAKRGAA
jgi:RNA polymerase sigma-70 factor (ECF subfamily)